MKTFDRIAIIFNTSKNRKQLDRYVAELRNKRTDIEIDIFPTTGLKDGQEQARKAAQNGYDLLVSAGGDGTLLGVVNGVIGTDIPITPLPFGNGNDTAKSLGIHNLEDAVKVIEQGTIRQIDVGRCFYHDEDGEEQHIHFCSTAGIGLFGEMFALERRFSTPVIKKVFGEMIWPIFTLLSILRSRSMNTEVSFDHHTCRVQLRLLEISKVKRAGGWLFTPDAMLDNGILDAWMLHRITRLQTMALTIRMVLNEMGFASPGRYDYFTSQAHKNSFNLHHIKSIKAMPEQPLAIHAHGEPLGFTPVQFELLPKALKILSCGDVT